MTAGRSLIMPFESAISAQTIRPIDNAVFICNLHAALEGLGLISFEPFLCRPIALGIFGPVNAFGHYFCLLKR